MPCRAAARYVSEHADQLPEDVVPTNGTAHAVLAVELYDAFLDGDNDPEVIRAAVAVRIGRRETTG